MLDMLVFKEEQNCGEVEPYLLFSVCLRLILSVSLFIIVNRNCLINLFLPHLAVECVDVNQLMRIRVALRLSWATYNSFLSLIFLSGVQGFFFVILLFK